MYLYEKEQITRRQFLKGALAGTAGLAAMSILGPAAFAEGSQIVDPAIGNEVHVISDTPYVMSGDQTYFVPDKVLSSGYTMPVIGIGTYALQPDVAENSVYSALKCGYHLVDTARAYWNEDGVGRGIKRAIEEGYIKREELFVTTKVWDSDLPTPGAACWAPWSGCSWIMWTWCCCIMCPAITTKTATTRWNSW